MVITATGIVPSVSLFNADERRQLIESAQRFAARLRTFAPARAS
jgi:hypothetical protein